MLQQQQQHLWLVRHVEHNERRFGTHRMRHGTCASRLHHGASSAHVSTVSCCDAVRGLQECGGRAVCIPAACHFLCTHLPRTEAGQLPVPGRHVDTLPDLQSCLSSAERARKLVGCTSVMLVLHHLLSVRLAAAGIWGFIITCALLCGGATGTGDEEL
jgi:hypothetical protein